MPEAASQGAGARPTLADEAAALRKTLARNRDDWLDRDVGEAVCEEVARRGAHGQPARAATGDTERPKRNRHGPGRGRRPRSVPPRQTPYASRQSYRTAVRRAAFTP